MSIYDGRQIYMKHGKITRYGSVQTLIHWVLRPLGITCAKRVVGAQISDYIGKR